MEKVTSNVLINTKLLNLKSLKKIVEVLPNIYRLTKTTCFIGFLP